MELFLRNLHKLARHCNFDNRESENPKERLIVGMADKELSQKL